MNRLLITTLTFILCCSATAHSYVRDYSKAEHLWQSDANKAFISGKAKFDDGTEVINLFVIYFDAKHGCAPVFKISFLDNLEEGDIIKTEPIDAGTLKLYVDNQLIYDGPVVNILSSNATEFGASVSPEMLIKLSQGKKLVIELVDTMDILFNLNNAKQHIDSAQTSCSPE